MGERNQRVFSLLEEQNKTKSAMAQTLGVSRSAISQWEKNGTEPTFEQCEKLSTFFNVSLEYLMTGKEKDWEPDFTSKDERDVQKELERTLNSLQNDTGLMFDGEVLDDETRELLEASLEHAIRTAKITAKKKFTPNKYRK